jgi:hypothetical protein
VYFKTIHLHIHTACIYVLLSAYAAGRRPNIVHETCFRFLQGAYTISPWLHFTDPAHFF